MQLGSRGRQLDLNRPPVDATTVADDEPCLLETVQVAGQRRAFDADARAPGRAACDGGSEVSALRTSHIGIEPPASAERVVECSADRLRGHREEQANRRSSRVARRES